MKREHTKNDRKPLPNALERVAELAQTLSPLEWENRLRHLQQDITTRRNISGLYLEHTADLHVPSSNLSLDARNHSSSKAERYQFPGQNQNTQIQFRIPTQLLQPRAQAQFATRSGTPAKEALLLNDSFSYENQPVLVQAWLERAPQPDRYILRLGIQGTPRLLRDGYIDLKWGKQEYTRSLKRGDTTFRIARPDLTKDLALTVTLAPHERTRPHSPSRSTADVPKRVAPKRAKKV